MAERQPLLRKTEPKSPELERLIQGRVSEILEWLKNKTVPSTGDASAPISCYEQLQQKLCVYANVNDIKLTDEGKEWLIQKAAENIAAVEVKLKIRIEAKELPERMDFNMRSVLNETNRAGSRKI